MPKVAITMPQLGESIAEATIVKFLVQPGDTVEVDQEIIEVETNKATMGVTTLCNRVKWMFRTLLRFSLMFKVSLFL